MKKIISILFLIFVGFMLFYIGLPEIAYGFLLFPVLLLVLLGVAIIIFTKLTVVPETKQVKIVSFPNKIFFVLGGLILAYIIILPLLTSLPMFRSESYQKMIGKVANGQKISNHIAPISIDKIRVVDEDLAHLLGEKILGSQPALGSQVELGDFCIQKVNNQLYWVAPLLHSGFFKWFNNQNGTAGYVMVSATNERDVKLVQQIDGKDVKIKYQQGAYFQSKIRRHLYFNGYTTTGLADFIFEIDDAGKPFWIVIKYEKKVGFAGEEAVGVISVDAQSGAIQEYSVAKTPLWIDRIQPINFIEEQLNDWGEYVHGYFNFSNTDKLQITEGLTLVYGENQKSYWYTGLTSVGKDESTVGFMLVDTRTKEATYYKQSGATELAAQHSAEGKVQEKGYKATMPIPYNINNIPTYVMALKDNGGLVKMYAMVGINDYTVVGVGNTLRETLTSFKNTYNMTGNKLSGNTPSVKKEVISIIVRIQNDVKNGNSFYYFILKDSPKVFVGSSNISTQLPISQIGDKIKVTYDEDLEKIIDISTFENFNLK